MSLKTFHIVFVSVSTILSFGVAGWAFKGYRMTGSKADLWFGIGGVVVGIGLLVYGRYFLKKLKKIGYL